MNALPRSLPVEIIPAATQFWRVHHNANQAVWFGPAPGQGPRNRFDAPAGEYKICYFGDSPEVSVAETVIRQPHTRLVTRATLQSRIISRLPVMLKLKLVALHGSGLLRLGIGADVAHGHPYAQCQALALALWQHDDAVDGIEYRSRWDNDRLCYAVFERAKFALGMPEHSLSLSDPHVFNPILRLYDIGVA